jgi:ataxia telangiectasia mutated family protein
VLRANSDLILTVLEVFKYDPLYVWEPHHEKNQREAAGGRTELNQSRTVLEKADRVLGSVRYKLSDTLSPEYSVNMLVQQARDVENLATIFHGEFSAACRPGGELMARLASVVLNV